MRHFGFQRLARFSLCTLLAHCALACGADTDHGPPIGSPTGPGGPVVVEGGGFGGLGQGGSSANTGGNATGTIAGASNTEVGGADSFGIGGDGSAGRDPFGIAGASTDPFGIGGNPSALPLPGAGGGF